MTKEEYWLKYNSFDLCEYCYKDFDTWWNPDRFNWFYSSDNLCKYIPDKFDTWWDSKEFGWKHGSRNLCNYILHKIIIWWNPDKLDFINYRELPKFLINNKIVTLDTSEELTSDFIKEYINNLEWNYN